MNESRIFNFLNENQPKPLIANIHKTNLLLPNQPSTSVKLTKGCGAVFETQDVPSEALDLDLVKKLAFEAALRGKLELYAEIPSDSDALIIYPNKPVRIIDKDKPVTFDKIAFRIGRFSKKKTLQFVTLGLNDRNVSFYTVELRYIS